MDAEPVLPYEMQWIWDGFTILNTSRQLGFDMGPIPISEVDAYVRLFEVPDVEIFVACIRAADAMYLQHFRDKNAQRSKAK